MKVIDAATAAESPEDVLWVGTSWKMNKGLADAVSYTHLTLPTM